MDDTGLKTLERKCVCVFTKNGFNGNRVYNPASLSVILLFMTLPVLTLTRAYITLFLCCIFELMLCLQTLTIWFAFTVKYYTCYTNASSQFEDFGKKEIHLQTQSL